MKKLIEQVEQAIKEETQDMLTNREYKSNATTRKITNLLKIRKALLKTVEPKITLWPVETSTEGEVAFPHAPLPWGQTFISSMIANAEVRRREETRT